MTNEFAGEHPVVVGVDGSESALHAVRWAAREAVRRNPADGDAHFVLLDSNGVTGPAITVVDVAAGLRPHPLPGPGDALSAAGPVLTGSFGQPQIEADVVHVGS